MQHSKPDKVLSRTEFQKAVFERDRHVCVICKKEAADAHHIIERRLWGTTGGYYISNGASLCEDHHKLAEQTVLSCEDIRKAAGIEKVILPPHLYDEFQYTKWADIVFPTGMRLKGDLFFDPSVQKILKEGNVLDRYSPYIKYPRTFHLPFSLSKTNDDRTLEDTSHFEGQEVVVTVKIDGEQTTFYDDYFHCRSIDYQHESHRNWVKYLHEKIRHEIPKGWRLNGENVTAVHSIKYSNLETYFFLFSIWNEVNQCLSWDETVQYADILNLKMVPILYRGVWDEKKIRSIYTPTYNGNPCEGYVVRMTRPFFYGEFHKCVAKFVREGHVGTNHHWKEHITFNDLMPNILPYTL
jgi:hypothetical protein